RGSGIEGGSRPARPAPPSRGTKTRPAGPAGAPRRPGRRGRSAAREAGRALVAPTFVRGRRREGRRWPPERDEPSARGEIPSRGAPREPVGPQLPAEEPRVVPERPAEAHLARAAFQVVPQHERHLRDAG